MERIAYDQSIASIGTRRGLESLRAGCFARVAGLDPTFVLIALAISSADPLGIREVKSLDRAWKNDSARLIDRLASGLSTNPALGQL